MFLCCQNEICLGPTQPPIQWVPGAPSLCSQKDFKSVLNPPFPNRIASLFYRVWVISCDITKNTRKKVKCIPYCWNVFLKFQCCESRTWILQMFFRKHHRCFQHIVSNLTGEVWKAVKNADKCLKISLDFLFFFGVMHGRQIRSAHFNGSYHAAGCQF